MMHSPRCTFEALGGPCPNGCHDAIPFEAGPGLEIVLDLIEMVANGDLPEFEARLDPRTGYDALEEVTEAGLLILIDDETKG